MKAKIQINSKALTKGLPQKYGRLVEPNSIAAVIYKYNERLFMRDVEVGILFIDVGTHKQVYRRTSKKQWYYKEE